jgi:hypothetical protein
MRSFLKAYAMPETNEPRFQPAVAVCGGWFTQSRKATGKITGL